MKQKAQKVPTTLGGGQLGYLALILPVSSYNTILRAAPFVRPTDPCIFAPTANAGIVTRVGARAAVPLTVAGIATQNITHDETKQLYNKTHAVESTLRIQLTTAINGNYLCLLRNVHTDMINDSIHDIFTFLRTTYGKITTGQLKSK